MSTGFDADVDQDLMMTPNAAADGFTEDDAKAGGGGGCNKPGHYHVLVTSIKAVKKENPDSSGAEACAALRTSHAELAGLSDAQIVKSGKYKVFTGENVVTQLKLTMEILAGDHDDQVGRKIWMSLYLAKGIRQGADIAYYGPPAKGSSDAMYRTALKLNLASLESLAKNAPINWGAGIDRMLICKVDEQDEMDLKLNKTTGRKEYRVNFGNVWSLDEDEVASVKRNAGSMAAAAMGGIDISDLM